eukprot:1636775-Rhodomonas_salina.1
MPCGHMCVTRGSDHWTAHDLCDASGAGVAFGVRGRGEGFREIGAEEEGRRRGRRGGRGKQWSVRAGVRKRGLRWGWKGMEEGKGASVPKWLYHPILSVMPDIGVGLRVQGARVSR